MAIPSVTGSESAAVAFLRKQAAEDGLRVLDDAAGNFVAEAGTGPRRLWFVGHIDTVPGHIDVRVEDGQLWGRGAVDAKGPLAAAYCAARRHKDSRALTVRIVGAVDEEGRSRGAKALATEPKPDWIVIGEPSGVHAVTLAYKGILRGSFTLQRARQHGAHPGPTAVEEAIALWDAWKTHYGLRDTFEAMQGHLASLVTQEDGLMDQVTAKFNLRIPPGTSAQAVEAHLRDSAAKAQAQLVVEERLEAVESPKRSDLVAAFMGSIREGGGEVRLLRKTGTCDFNVLAPRLPGVPIVAYGPGDASLDHTPQERIQLDEYRQAIEVLDRVMGRLGA